MHLPTKTNLAARVLMACALNEGRALRTAEIARLSNASLNHLSQVVNSLRSSAVPALEFQMSRLERVKGIEPSS